MVPRFSISSSRLMPTPLSATVSVPAALSARMRDAQLGLVAEQLRLLQRQRAQFFAGVGGVGDQFAQEDVAVRIDRVHHQMEQTRDVRLERTALGRLCASAASPVSVLRPWAGLCVDLSLPRKASSGLRPGKAAAGWDRGAGRSRTAPLPASISRSVRRISRLPWNFTVSLCALSLVPRWELSRQSGAAKKKGPAQADPKGTLDLYRVLRRIRPPVRGAGGLIKPRPAIGSLATGRLSRATGAGDCCRKGRIMAAHHVGVRFPAGPARAGLVEPCRPWRVGRERGSARQRTVRDWLETFG